MKALKYLPLGLMTLVAAGSLVGNYVLYKDLKAARANPQPKSDQDNAQLVDRVRRLMVIPDEAPTIATVTDPEKLKDQAFFANAKTGDKVLIFSAAKKAILYDPVADKIVEVAPLTVNNPPTVDGQTAPAAKPPAKSSDDTNK